STGGSLSTHHNDPFLTCVRQCESGGRYQIDSANGLYHGAYQFLQSTWDATARHIGGLDLVGIDPHTASPTLQDDMAWALFQWHGRAPWAGSGCWDPGGTRPGPGPTRRNSGGTATPGG